MWSLRRMFMFIALVVAWIAGTGVFAEDATPLPTSGGQLLFVSRYAEFDAKYGQELTDAGYTWVKVSPYDRLPAEFFRQFSTIIIDSFPGESTAHGVFGQKMIAWWENYKNITSCLEQGAGVLVYTDLADCGGDLCEGWNREMKPFDIKIGQSCVRDPSIAFSPWKAFGENFYAWTSNFLPKHPVTEGVERHYYSSANLRWDDCYTSPPLLCGKEWAPIIRAMPGALVGNEVNSVWYYEPVGVLPPVLGAVRKVGKGRMAALSLHPTYTHRAGYMDRSAKVWWGEMCFGPVNGMILKTGDRIVPSGTGKLLLNLYQWLGEGAKAGGLGGFVAGSPVPLLPAEATEEEAKFTPVIDWNSPQMPASWRHRPTKVMMGDKAYFPEFRDPLVTGELKFFRALVGAHSALSDGAGGVKDYALAAKAAGYDAIVFTEALEEMSPEKFAQLKAECAENTTDDFVCLPGLQVRDPYDNIFLLLNAPYFPRAQWLTADGKRLVKTQMINLCMGGVHVVAHRVATSSLTPERLKHFQGMSVQTYRKGKLMDDSRPFYAWQVESGSNPHPYAVHEVFSPDEVAQAAKTGLQQLLPGAQLQKAVSYMSTGAALYFDAPARYMVSSGPVVNEFVVGPKDVGPAEENRDRFRVNVSVSSDEPLASVTLYDGQNIVRRWYPQGKKFSDYTMFAHDRQYGLYVVAEDVKGRYAITNSARTVAARYHFRCSDRQNWLGDVAAIYAGADIPRPTSFALPAEGTSEAAAQFPNIPGTMLATKLNFPFTTPNVVLTEAVGDEVFQTALRSDVGCDATPAQVARSSSTCTLRVRNFSLTGSEKSPYYPTVLEYSVRLKRALKPASDAVLFPTFAFTPTKELVRPDAAGNLQRSELPKDGVLDLPVGTLAGGVLILSPGLSYYKGHIGMRAPVENLNPVPVGTEYAVKILVMSHRSFKGLAPQGGILAGKPEEVLPVFGIGLPTPYELKFTVGVPERGAYPLPVKGESGAMAGRVTKTAQTPFPVALKVSGQKRLWPFGTWQEATDIRLNGSFEGDGYALLDVSKEGAFYAGPMLIASDPDLVLSFQQWDADTVKAEVHNPTKREIKATVRTPSEVKGHKALNVELTIPAGSTVRCGE